MKELLARVTEATGLDAETATRAIGIILNFLRKEGPPAEADQLLASMPGAESAMVAGAGAALLLGNGAALMGAIVVGGVGILGILYALLVGRARRQVGQATAEVVRLQVVFLAYLRQLRQIDEAYVRRLLDDADFPASEVREFQQMVAATMDATLDEIPAQSPAAVTVAGPLCGLRPSVTVSSPSMKSSDVGSSVVVSVAPSPAPATKVTVFGNES